MHSITPDPILNKGEGHYATAEFRTDADCLDKLCTFLGGVMGAVSSMPKETAGATAAATGIAATATGIAAIPVALLAILAGGKLWTDAITERKRADITTHITGAAREIAKTLPADDLLRGYDTARRKALQTDLIDALRQTIPETDAERHALLITLGDLDPDRIADTLAERLPEDSPFRTDETRRAYFTDTVALIWSRLSDNPHFREDLRQSIDADFLARLTKLQETVDQGFADTRTDIASLSEQVTTLQRSLEERGANPAELDAFKDKIEAESAKRELAETRLANLMGLILKRPIPPDQIVPRLQEANAKAAEEAAEAARIPNDESDALRDLRLARLAALEARDLDRAKDLSRAFAEQRRTENRAQERAAWVEAAEDARNALDYRAAAEAYAEAAATVDEADTQERWKWFYEEWYALYLLGLEYGDNAALEGAAAKADTMTRAFPRADHPALWAKAMGNRANTLQELGEREQGTARLDEAVTAFRALLPAFADLGDRESWATAQNNLGAVLQTLGQRESGTDRLHEAVAAYREALKEYTRERVPLDWAMTWNNLGNALLTLGERESGTDRLNEAVAAYREALKERSRERVPLDWAMTWNNLGAALWALGQRESGTDRLHDAVAAYREALKERTRERVPYWWAQTQENMAILYGTMADRTGQASDAARAVTHATDALEVYRAAGATYDIDKCEPLLADCQTLHTRLLAGEGEAKSYT